MMEALVWPLLNFLKFWLTPAKDGLFFFNQDIYYKIHRSIAIFDKNIYHLSTTF